MRTISKPIRLTVVALVGTALIAVISLLSTPAAEAQAANPGPFSCEVDAGQLSWPDHTQTKYWVYRSLDGGASYSWLGRTTGATQFADPTPQVGAQYQVHYAGIGRVDCSINTEPGGELLAPFECAMNDGVLSWPDHEQGKYWIYQSFDNKNYTWIGRTTGATEFQVPQADPYAGNVSYQVHYQGLARTKCTLDDPTSPEPLPPLTCNEDYNEATDITTLTWSDEDTDLYWVYRSLDNGPYEWFGRTLGELEFEITNPEPNARYEIKLRDEGPPMRWATWPCSPI